MTCVVSSEGRGMRGMDGRRTSWRNMAEGICLTVVRLFPFVILLCMTDVFVESQNSPSRSSDKSISNLGVKNYLGPTLKFLYWW